MRLKIQCLLRGGQQIPIETEQDIVLRSILDLDAMRQAGITLTPTDLSPIEARGLVMLNEERIAHQERESRWQALRSQAK